MGKWFEICHGEYHSIEGGSLKLVANRFGSVVGRYEVRGIYGSYGEFRATARGYGNLDISWDYVR